MSNEHRIRHYVYAGDQLIPRESTMRGAWHCDAKCSCGWETRTGGAVRSYVNRMVDEHKADVRLAASQKSRVITYDWRDDRDWDEVTAAARDGFVWFQTVDTASDTVGVVATRVQVDAADAQKEWDAFAEYTS